MAKEIHKKGPVTVETRKETIDKAISHLKTLGEDDCFILFVSKGSKKITKSQLSTVEFIEIASYILLNQLFDQLLRAKK